MNRILQYLTITLVCVFSSQLLNAQNNLTVSFDTPASVPDFLNICGDPDAEVVRIGLVGSATDTRTNIVATAHLFKGVELVSFDAGASSPGVTLANSSDPSNPVFNLPDLSPSGTASVVIAFSVAANCEYTDTITANDQALVLDTWEFVYDLGPSTGLQEFDSNTEYRDAFAVPNFTADMENLFGKARVGDCMTRDIVVTSSGLDGFIDSLYYDNLQGEGVWIQGITVNGIPLTITKTLSGTDTLITGVLDASHFALNTVGGNPGNGDGFFDPNETVVITETLCLLNCTTSRASVHDMSWGCGGRYCETTTVTDFIEIGQGAANVLGEEVGILPDQFAGYCQTGNTTITFINDGVEVDPGFATMLNLELGIGLGATFLMADGGFTISSMTISGVAVPVSAMTLLDGNPLFTTDPDGPGGLSDFDGDGYFDDLMLNDSVEITAYYDFDCSMAQELGDDETCPNDLSTSFNARLDYDDTCADRIIALESNFLRPSNTRPSYENFSDTDAFALTDTFFVTHTQTRSVRFFEKSCSSGEELQVTVVLPPGINPIISETYLSRNEASFYPLTSSTISNDTLYLIYDASFTNFVIGDYEIRLAFQADCSAPLGPTDFNTAFAFYCPDCDCKHIWWCGDLQGPTIHSTDPPCPPVPCDPGLKTLGFEVNRTTFGYTDNTYTTPFDQDMANKKVAISCDSVEMRILNIVGEQAISDSIGMVITYSNIDETYDSTETFLFDFGILRVTHLGTEYTCTVDSTALTVEFMDSTKILHFDLDSCLIDFGITLDPVDTVEFIANFTVNPDGPFPVQFRSVPNLRAYGFAELDGIEYPCDNFGDEFTIAKNITVFDAPNTSDFPEGCETAYLEYRLITINNGFTDWFGTEYRQAVRIDSISFNFDPFILDGFDIFEPEVSIPGHPVHGSSYYSVPGFDLSPSGLYVARFDTLLSVPSLNEVSSYSFNFRIQVTPNCHSDISSASGNSDYTFVPQIYYRDRYYASVIGDGSCSPELTDNSVVNVITYNNPPVLSFLPVTDPNYTLSGDTAVWEIQHCNTSFDAAAGVTWIALEDTTGAVQVVSMEDISNSSSITNLTVIPYGTNSYYAETPGLSLANGSSTIDEICNTIRIKAVVSQCGTTSFHTRSGWNCVFSTDPSWSPELYPPCDDLTVAHTVTTLDPFLDANVVEQASPPPGMCDTVTIGVLLRNTDQGAIFDLVSQFILPLSGGSLVPGGVEIAYPSSSAYVSVPTDPTYVGASASGQIYQYDDFSDISAFLDANGLKGFNPLNAASDSNEMRIRYRFVTDCDFIGGSIARYTFQGLKGCGDSTNFETGETLPIYIEGGDPIPPREFETYFSNNSALIPGQTASLELTFVNTDTAAVTDTLDKVSLRLPLNYEFNPTSSTPILPGSWSTMDTDSDTIAGFQTIYWCMPPGLMPGDSAVWSFDVTAPFIECDTTSIEVELYTVARVAVNCPLIGEDCNLHSITSTNVGTTETLPVLQNILDFDFNLVASICNGGDEEQITITGAVANPGQDFNAGNFGVEYYYDSNASGDYDIGDLLLGLFNESGPIPSYGALPFEHTFAVQDNQACNIIIRIDSTGIGLCQNTELLLPEPQLLNAGEDQLFCATAPTTIITSVGDAGCLSMSNYTYNWTAIPPANAATDLSSTNIPNPVLSIPQDPAVQDTLYYILETTRPSCAAVSNDTVAIIRGIGMEVVMGGPIEILPGADTLLMPMASGGILPYMYEWELDPTLDNPNIANPTVNPTVDTWYTVTITSAGACTVVDSVLVFIANNVNAEVNASDTTVCEGSSYELMASGGTDYLWESLPGNPPNGTLSAFNIANPIFSGGLQNEVYNYHVIVTDVAFPGEVDTATVQITIPLLPTVSATTPGTGISCGNGEMVTLNASGATIYTWSVNGNTVGVLPTIVVSPDSTTVYDVIGTDTNTGCTDTDQITITVNAVNAVANASTSATCLGDTVFLTTPNMGTQVNWYDGTTLVGTGSPVAVVPTVQTTYRLTVESAMACQDTATVTVDVLPLPTITSTPVADFSRCDGEIFPVSITIGEDIQSYSIEGTGAYDSDSLTTTNTLNFNAIYTSDTATFEVYLYGVTDGCAAVETFSIIPCPCESPVVISTAVSQATCGNFDGGIEIHINDDPANYNWLWSPGVGSGNILTGLLAGTYTVQIINNNNPDCNTTVSVAVSNGDGPMATYTSTPATCAADDGTVTLTPLGYIYDWGMSNTDNPRNDLTSGTHFVTVTDPANPTCPNYLAVLVDEENPLSATVETVVVPDCGVANGTVTVHTLGGSDDYTFTWEDGFVSTDSTRTNLEPGTYNLTITDNGPLACELEVVFVLNANVPPATITINSAATLSCEGADNGAVLFDIVYDGLFTAPADTTITDGTDRYTNGNLPAGDYCIMITDGNGCVAGNSCFTIEEPDPILLAYTISPACAIPIFIDLEVTGGTGPYTYNWNPGDTNEDQSVLNAGDFQVTVTDFNLCPLQDMVTVLPCTACQDPTLNSIQMVEADCGFDNGQALVSLYEDENNYTYTWLPDVGTSIAPGNSRTNLPFGGYTILVEDTAFPTCNLEVELIVTNTDGPTATYTSTPATCAAADGTAMMSPDSLDYLWSYAGMGGANPTDLTSGAYFVTITDLTDPDCQNVMQVIIQEDNPLLAVAETVVSPDCGIANGEVTIHASGGSGDYSFYWPPSVTATDSVGTNMLAGIYAVTIVDNDVNVACELPFIFVLEDDVPPATVTITDTIDVSCPGAADGSILFDIVFDGLFTQPADTIISDAFQAYENGSLPPGSYCIYITDGNGCVAGSGCFEIEAPDELELFFVMEEDCGGTGSVDVSVLGGTPSYTYDWVHIPGTDDPEDLTGLSAGTLSLLVTDAAGCTIEETEVIIPICSDPCEIFSSDSTWLQVSECGGSGYLCLNLSIENILDYLIYDNGVLYDGDIAGCNWDSIGVYAYSELFGQGNLGPYLVTSWEINGDLFMGEFQDIPGLLDSMNVWDPTGNWTLSSAGQFILGGNQNNIYSPIEIDAIDFGTTSVLGINFIAEPNGFTIELEEGFHEVIITDTVLNCTDTLYLSAVCTTPDTIYFPVEVGTSDTLCLNGLELVGTLDTMYNICPDLDFSSIVFIDGTYCMEITGVIIGVDTACIVACDDLGICDTTYVIIDVIPPYNLVIEDVCLGEMNMHCVDTSLLDIPGTPVTMTNVCSGLSGESIVFELDVDSFCVSYIGLFPGLDTACVELCDAMGNCDTMSYFITSIPCVTITPEWVIDTVFIFETDTFCIDTTELPGNMIVSFENVCEGEGTGDVDFYLDPITLCVNYTGLELGKDTACIVACDELGYCDTTYFCIFVEPFLEGPYANDDGCDTTNIGTPIVLDVIANDTLFDGKDTMYILQEPLYGTATVNLDCSITYNPSDEFCERSDEFTYMVCTPNGCDSATVCIWISCVDIVIFTAVSPNRDGSNDVFFIAGILDFPDSELTIFNRWGNAVFETVGYRNDWSGTWDGNKDLPDGTYWYELKLNDETNRVFRGYLEIYR